MIWSPPMFTRTTTRFPDTTLSRSASRTFRRPPERHPQKLHVRGRARHALPRLHAHARRDRRQRPPYRTARAALYRRQVADRPARSLGEGTALAAPSFPVRRRGSLFGRLFRRHAAAERGEARRARHGRRRSEEHTSELQSLMRISYAVFCLKKKKKNKQTT